MAEDSIVCCSRCSCVGVYRRRRAGGSGLKVWRGKADVQHAGYLMNHTLGDRWYVHYAHGRDSRPAEDKLSYPAGRIIILSVDSPDIG